MIDYTKESCIRLWQRKRQIEIPNGAEGKSLVTICRISRTIDTNQLPLDVHILAQSAAGMESFEFGVLFSDVPPEPNVYPIPVLWRIERDPGVGRFIKPTSKLG